MKKLSEVLTGPSTWCQHVSVKDRHGVMAFCLTAAMTQISGGDCVLLADVITELFPTWKSRDVVLFNDYRGRTWNEIAQVVEEYDRRMLLREGR